MGHPHNEVLFQIHKGVREEFCWGSASMVVKGRGSGEAKQQNTMPRMIYYYNTHAYLGMEKKLEGQPTKY